MTAIRDATPYDPHMWHDCALYAVRWQCGDPERGDWRSELVLDIDYIVEWIPDGKPGARFRVAPASLAFHDVTDLRVNLDWGDSGGQVAVRPLAILRIDRRPVERQKVCLDRGYYRWTVVVEGNSGDVAFCASAYTLDFRAPPVTLHEQTLPPAGRA